MKPHVLRFMDCLSESCEYFLVQYIRTF
uniref:Uncharacterized protein n=1 Tax=Rhizophora mucronata TaxID=61149 RepID=A0A2P2QAW3_RHIMU